MISENNFKLKKDGTPNCRCFCRNPELIENYEKAISDKSQLWYCHHRLETHFSDGTKRPEDAQLSWRELDALNMYFDRPPEELIFVTFAEHNALHFSGRKNQKLSAYNKTHREMQAIKSKAAKEKIVGSKWYNNGIICIRRKEGEQPDGFVLGRI